MKVLLAHNFYRSSSPSGEDQVFRNEKKLLEINDIDVVTYVRHNDDIRDDSVSDRVRVAHDTSWSRQTHREITRLLRKERPQLAHFHNTFPLISPSAYHACKENDVPVVQTLHNYRLVCPGALLLRNGSPCEDCVGKTPLSAVLHRCYRNSFAASAVASWMLIRNRLHRTYAQSVDRYLALTQFALDKFVAGGLPAARISIKPNVVLDTPTNIDRKPRCDALFVGRMSAEKGVRTLLRAWRTLPDIKLRIIGDGPLLESVHAQILGEGLNVELLGRADKETVLKYTARASVQIIPSECYEGFPMVLLEAFACKTPVVAARIGGIAEIVLDGKTGLLFEPGNADDLARKVRCAIADEPSKQFGESGHERFQQHYCAEANFRTLHAVYTSLLR